MDAKTLCLGVLVMGDASGYEIRKMFEEGPFAHFQDVGYGSIYPALSKLSEEGLIAVAETPGEGHPDKKVYAVTPAGRAVFRQSLARVPMNDKVRSDTAFLMFFAEFLDPDHLRAVYDDYLAFYRARVEIMQGLDPEGVPEGRLFVRENYMQFYNLSSRYI
ncbi:MAG: PadR family transcriptional regulator [Rhodospirillaceae bacterium]